MQGSDREIFATSAAILCPQFGHTMWIWQNVVDLEWSLGKFIHMGNIMGISIQFRSGCSGNYLKSAKFSLSPRVIDSQAILRLQIEHNMRMWRYTVDWEMHLGKISYIVAKSSAPHFCSITSQAAAAKWRLMTWWEPCDVLSAWLFDVDFFFNLLLF